MKEIWKDIPGYEGYYKVSNLGRVKSLNYNRTKKEKVLKLGIDTQGYYNLTLSKNGSFSTKNVHKLVAMAFLDHKPCGYKLVVNHKDFNKLNNKVENIEITTQRRNANQKHLKSTSKYVGVSWNKAKCKWESFIRINGKQNYLGTFKKEYDAHLAYQNKLKTL